MFSLARRVDIITKLIIYFMFIYFPSCVYVYLYIIHKHTLCMFKQYTKYPVHSANGIGLMNLYFRFHIIVFVTMFETSTYITLHSDFFVRYAYYEHFHVLWTVMMKEKENISDQLF